MYCMVNVRIGTYYRCLAIYCIIDLSILSARVGNRKPTAIERQLYEYSPSAMLLGASIVAFGGVLLWRLYCWTVATYGFFSRHNVPFTKPWPLLGNTASMLTQRQTTLELSIEFYERYKREP